MEAEEAEESALQVVMMHEIDQYRTNHASGWTGAKPCKKEILCFDDTPLLGGYCGKVCPELL